jgi:predicted unusual protein kinase regulating ubiquinone biosynthesis (AarF/ABC1/UbiB family)
MGLGLSLSGPLARARRTVIVGWTGWRIYRGYKRTQKRIAGLPPAERDAAWTEQHRVAAERIVRVATRLRGLFIKAAQFLGTRADLLPEPYIIALSTLHDRVPPQPYRTMRPVLRAGLGAEPESVFASFEREPIAAASLAQVHRARLRDGRQVAVKVQYPEIGRLVQLDLRNLTLLLRLVHRLERSLDFEPLVQAIGRLVPLELDFINEGRNSEAIAAELNHPDVFAPPVVWEHSSRRVLVMEFVDGIKVSDVRGLRAFGLEPRQVADRLVALWGEQVLRLGHFHADPHPGNILALADGRLALLDFGLVARLTPDVREQVARLCRGVADGQPAEIMAAFQGLGFKVPEDGAGSYTGLLSSMMTARGDADSVNGRLARALRSFQMQGVPGEALLVLRVLGLLSGLSASLGRRGPVLRAWRPFAEPLAERVAG